MKKKKDGYLNLNLAWRCCVFFALATLFLGTDYPPGIPQLSALGNFVIMGIVLGYGVITFLIDYFSTSASKNTTLTILDLLMGSFMLCVSPHFAAALIFSIPILISFRGGKSAGSWITFIIVSIFVFVSIIVTLVIPGHAIVPALCTPFIIIAFSIFYFAHAFGDHYAYLISQEERTQALISLIQVSQELGVSSSLQQVLTTGLNVVKALFPCHSCVIYMKSDDDKQESIVRVKAYSSKIPDAFIDFNPDITPSVIGKAMREKSDQLIGNYSSDLKEDIIPKDKGFRSMMISPLPFEDKAIGALLVVHTVPDYYTEEDMKLFSMLSAQIGLAVRNIQIQQTMGTMAITDSLSGLFTHGYFQENLSEGLTKAKYDNKPLSMMIIDVDFFKKVNDTYGHPQGDALLKQLGGVLRSMARKEDVLCRYGGDEFTVTMYNTNRISAVILAEKIRTAVEEYEFVVKGQVAHITISGGVASFPEDAQTKKELVECADKAMYQSKQAGRNKISFGVTKK